MAQRPPSRNRPPHRKRGDEEAEDAFVASVYEATTWAQRNRLTLIVLGIVVAAAAVGLYSYMDYRERLNEQALVQLEQIHQTVSMGDAEQAKADLSQFLSRFGNTPHAGEAHLLLGELYLRSDQPDAAAQLLADAGISLRRPMGVQIEMLRARALEASGDTEGAIEAYLEVADAAELDFQMTEALSSAARLHERQGDRAAAVALYEQILETLDADAEDRGDWEMRLAEARARAGTLE